MSRRTAINVGALLAVLAVFLAGAAAHALGVAVTGLALYLAGVLALRIDRRRDNH